MTRPAALLAAAARRPLGILFQRLAIVMLLYALCRGLFYVFNAGKFDAASPATVAIAFLYGLRFDLSALVSTNGFFILGHALPLPCFYAARCQKVLKVLFYLSNGPFLALNCVDIALFRFTKKRATAALFSLLDRSEVDVMRQVVVDYWYLIVVFGLLMVVAEVLYRRVRTGPRPAGRSWWLWQGALFFPMVVLCVFAQRGGTQSKPVNMIDAAERSQSGNLPLILNTPFCVLKTLGTPAVREVHYLPPGEARREFSAAQRLDAAGGFRKLNVVIIIMESMGREYVGSVTGEVSYTPCLDALSREGICFTQAYANGLTSMEAMPAILAGIPTLMPEPFVTSPYAENRLCSLPGLLKAKGYRALFFHGGNNGTMHFDSFAKAAGFDRYVGRNEYPYPEHFDGCWGIRDEEFFQYFAHQLQATPEPFLGCIFSLSAHHPFTIPEKHQGRFTKGTSVIHESMMYADYSLGRFFETASQMDWFDNTVFVVTGDHTFYSDDPFYKNRVGEYAVPLVMRGPHEALHGRSDATVQHIDILPTILEILGYDKPFVAFGRSVLDPTPQRYAVSFSDGLYQIVSGNLALHHSGNAPVAFYDFGKDPALTHNLYGEQPAEEHRLARQLEAVIQDFNRRMIRNELDDAHGYRE